MGGSEEGGGNAIFERLKMQDLKTHDAPNAETWNASDQQVLDPAANKASFLRWNKFKDNYENIRKSVLKAVLLL